MAIIRNDFFLADVTMVLKELIQTKIDAGSPWDRWKVIPEYPTATVKGGFEKPIIFIADIQIIPEQTYQYGGQANQEYYAECGVWVNNEHGGIAELSRCISSLSRFFNVASCNKLVIPSLKIGATTYTNQTLLNYGIGVYMMSNTRPIQVEKKDEHRKDFTLKIRSQI